MKVVEEIRKATRKRFSAEEKTQSEPENRRFPEVSEFKSKRARLQTGLGLELA